jgi:hypothetical protein
MDTRDFQASRALRLLATLLVAVFAMWIDADAPQPVATLDASRVASPSAPGR